MPVTTLPVPEWAVGDGIVRLSRAHGGSLVGLQGWRPVVRCFSITLPDNVIAHPFTITTLYAKIRCAAVVLRVSSLVAFLQYRVIAPPNEAVVYTTSDHDLKIFDYKFQTGQPLAEVEPCRNKRPPR